MERGLTVVGEGRLSNGSIVRSSNFSNVWFLAADIQGPGMDGREMGVWATNEPGGGGTLLFCQLLREDVFRMGRRREDHC